MNTMFILTFCLHCGNWFAKLICAKCGKETRQADIADDWQNSSEADDVIGRPVVCEHCGFVGEIVEHEGDDEHGKVLRFRVEADDE